MRSPYNHRSWNYGVAIGRQEKVRARLLRQSSVTLGRFAVRWAKPILILVFMVTAVLAPFAKKALDNYDDDVLKFLPADAPEVVNFRQMGLRFHGLSIAVVGLEAPTGDLFSVERIRWLRSLTQALRDTNELPGVAFASSYTELPDLITLTKENEFGVVEKIDLLPQCKGSLHNRVFVHFDEWNTYYMGTEDTEDIDSSTFKRLTDDFIAKNENAIRTRFALITGKKLKLYYDKHDKSAFVEIMALRPEHLE